MLGIEGYGAYLAAVVALCLTPGIDTVYILTRTMAGGRREGIASALGINTGLVIHAVLVASGLSLLLAASELAFTAIKVAGAAYLAFLGVRAILSRGAGFSLDAGNQDDATSGDVDDPISARARALRVYGQGVLTNVLNPKIILFFLALLPQFVAVPNAHGPLPFLLLGLTYAALSTVWTVILVLIASPFSRLLARSPRAARMTGVASGVVYVALGALVLLG